MCNETDKRMFKALIHVLENGRFDLSGKEAVAFYKVFEWVVKLEKKNTQKQTKVNGGNNGN